MCCSIFCKYRFVSIYYRSYGMVSVLSEHLNDYKARARWLSPFRARRLAAQVHCLIRTPISKVQFMNIYGLY